MRLRCGALAILILGPAGTAAQQMTPGVWFSSPSPTGASADARFEVKNEPTGVVIQWAPFGKSPVSWGSVVPGSDGSVEFHWSGNPTLPCTLRGADERNYEGMCQGPGQIARQLRMSRNGPPNGLELPVSDKDFRILRKARHILAGPSAWNRHDDRYCEDDGKQRRWSLFCALYQASFDAVGEYVHLRPVMEEVRAAVGEVTRRSFQHQLMDYNNLESTTYADIETIFDLSEKRLRMRKVCTESLGSKWATDGRSAVPLAQGAKAPPGGQTVFWGEGLRYTVQQKTYVLREILGPKDGRGSVPDEWYSASTAVARRTSTHNDLQGMDVKGTLSNGNQWRYFCLCGESWIYYDVPAEAAAFFNRVIDGAYLNKL